MPTTSAVLDDGAILEMVLRPAERRTAFVLWRDGQWRFESGLIAGPFHRLVPYSPNNNLIRNEVVLLPSEPEEYGSEAELVAGIQASIHRCVDVSPVPSDRRLALLQAGLRQRRLHGLAAVSHPRCLPGHADHRRRRLPAVG